MPQAPQTDWMPARPAVHASRRIGNYQLNVAPPGHGQI
jgi:hypothetical protein